MTKPLDLQAIKQRAATARADVLALVSEIESLRGDLSVGAALLADRQRQLELQQAANVEMEREVERLRAAQGWRDISTAPKDGKLILLLRAEYDAEVGTAKGGYTVPASVIIGGWSHGAWSEYDNDGAWTHWQPWVEPPPRIPESAPQPPQNACEVTEPTGHADFCACPRPWTDLQHGLCAKCGGWLEPPQNADTSQEETAE